MDALLQDYRLYFTASAVGATYILEAHGFHFFFVLFYGNYVLNFMGPHVT